MSKRKIAIFTGNRAEYGLQFPIIKAVDEHPDLEYYLLVSGAHLQEDFGKSVQEIEKDGFRIHSEVKITMGDDSLYATAQAIGSGILSLSAILRDIRPDFHVVYADRFEGFSAVITSTQMNIPTAHIEGGDITEGGALDDSVRHAMTKLSHLHFTTNEEAAERVRRLGEEPWRVFNVGFPAIDLISRGMYATPEELRERFGIVPDRPVVLFTQHSVTTEFESAAEQIRPSLEAMVALAGEGVQVIVTYPNNDAGGMRIIKEIESLSQKKLPNLHVYRSLGRYNYHGVLNLCGRAGTGACVGNSSSGIKETPAFGCPTVNIGSRQNGRLRSTNVIDADYSKKTVYEACRKALFDADFRAQSAVCKNPYGEGNSGKRIAEVLATIDISPKLLQKKMTY
ncbi:MAG TPA: UDP-N-acetylglucosamine 2-epimerase [Spirochaetota bacterium]|nr:UDP-N-acetylglucosamine 2-epimerase [Spirochaetota bacterium]HNT11641.1 UDP-N-acetylglucosamine 2-epimerase [Spirochaetota bacterium]